MSAHGHRITLLERGEAYFPALIAALDAAREEVFFESYIFDPRRAGEAVAHALMRAAERGVAVWLMMDGIGSSRLSQEWQDRLVAAGVRCHVYLPFTPWSIWLPTRWRRLHRKLCVIDGQVGFCGGINVIDDYLDLDDDTPLRNPRFDYAVRVEGRVVPAMRETMRQLWTRVEALQDLRAHDLQALRRLWRRTDFEFRPSPRGEEQLVLRDNLRYRRRIEQVYLAAIHRAKDEILIASAYFFPGGRLRRALQAAARRGVKVSLLLQGHSDHWLAYRAARVLFAQLLAAGVQIYEYPFSFMHAKVAVIDRRWATVGSSNLDPLSLLLAREANLVMKDKHFASELAKHLSHAMARSGPAVDPWLFVRRHWSERWRDRLASTIMRLGIWLTCRRY